MTTPNDPKHFLQCWEHSDELFRLLMEVTSDERIEMEIRLQLLAKVRAAVAKAQSKNTPPTNPNYTSFIHPQGRAEQ